MAVDLLVMPLSRYKAGDYVTPMMRAMWATGVPYTITNAEGTRELPKDTPLGGPDAAAYRRQILGHPMFRAELQAIANRVGELWDEASNVEPAFFRLSHAEFSAVREAAFPRAAKGLARLLRRPPVTTTHLRDAQTLLPGRFAATFEVDGDAYGSLEAAEAELAGAVLAEPLQPALETVRDALATARRLRLPLSIDV